MTINLLGELLTASDEDMTIEYNLLTFGEPGRTNKGTVTVDGPGILTIPAGQLPVNSEHDARVSTGYMIASEHDTGLRAKQHFFDTPEGRTAYKEAKGGKRSGISVEILKPLVRAGKLLAGALVGAGNVEKPAFPSSLMIAADVGELEAGIGDALAALEAGDTAAAIEALKATQAKAAESETPEPNKEEEETVPPKLNASALKLPANTPASSDTLVAAMFKALGGELPAPQEPTAEEQDKLTASSTLTGFCDAIRTIESGVVNGEKLTAALATVTQGDVLDPAAQPEFLGELWNDTIYDERWTPLVEKKDLTALTVKGWEWVEGMTPIADDWDPAYTQGNYEAEPPTMSSMNDIPSRPLKAVGKEWTAKRIAGGNRFDRAIIDFPVPGQVESLLREQTEYIKRRRDARVKAELIRIAKPIIGTGNDVANPWRKIILGCQHVLEKTKPTYVILGNDIWRDLLGTDMLENLALLEKSLNLESGTMAGFKFQPAEISDTSMNGRVIVGSSKATVLHQKGGDAPISVDAQELVKGAIDKAVFSYYLLRSNTEPGGTEEAPTNYAKYGVVEVKS